MRSRIFVALCIVIASFQTLGCAHHDHAISSASRPLGELIQPAKDSRQLSGKTPLALPASVAIVSVPDRTNHVPNTTLRLAATNLKKQLLAYPKYVSSVSIVTEDEINNKISLEQVRAVYSADIVVTLSYQQDQRSSQSGAAGLMDAAVVGNFVVPGVQITTSSIIDGRVIHIPNNAVIFRATGTDERSVHSTSYSENGTILEESINGIVAATADFGNALTKALTKFDDYDFSQAVPVSALMAANAADGAKGKPANDYWKKVDTYKSGGGGAFGLAPLLMVACACLAVRRRR